MEEEQLYNPNQNHSAETGAQGGGEYSKPLSLALTSPPHWGSSLVGSQSNEGIGMQLIRVSCLRPNEEGEVILRDWTLSK